MDRLPDRPRIGWPPSICPDDGDPGRVTLGAGASSGPVAARRRPSVSAGHEGGPHAHRGDRRVGVVPVQIVTPPRQVTSDTATPTSTLLGVILPMSR